MMLLRPLVFSSLGHLLGAGGGGHRHQDLFYENLAGAVHTSTLGHAPHRLWGGPGLRYTAAGNSKRGLIFYLCLTGA